MPKFPDNTTTGYQGIPDKTYAQSFLCITLKFATFDDLGFLMQINHPKVYDYSFPSSFASSLPNYQSRFYNITNVLINILS